MTNSTNCPDRASIAQSPALAYANLTKSPDPAVALPLAPDPALAAFDRWRGAMAAYLARLDRPDHTGNEPELLAFENAAHAAARALAATVPASVAGIAAQLQFAVYALGESKERFQESRDPDDRVSAYIDPDNFTFGTWNDDRAASLLRSLRTGSERLAAASTIPDPVLAFLPALTAARDEHLRLLEAFRDLERAHGPADQGPEIDAAVGTLKAAEAAIAELVPTSIEGVAAQLRVMVVAKLWDSPGMADDLGAKFAASLIQAIDGLAQRGA